MVKTYKPVKSINARLYVKYGLVFFCASFFLGCGDHSAQIALVYKKGRAVGIQIPKELVGNVTATDANESVKITLIGKGNKQAGILGEFSGDGTNLLFSPLIPLTPGMGYTVVQGGKTIGSVTVPVDDSAPPRLVAIYPETDTLPENTLKIYLHFSQPMRTGRSLGYVSLLDKNKDTMRNVFLNLQPELWDTSGTVLTLWLDPGRIKRGLVLNRQLGNPLKKSESYQLIVDNAWKDTHGHQLDKQYAKQFVTGVRDEAKPDITLWQITLPKAGSRGPIVINAGKPLDHYLLQECLGVNNANGSSVDGVAQISGKDQVWTFTPSQPWKVTIYTLRVRATLEDLAGNNLNRVFDRDITKDKVTDKQFVERNFTVK